MSILINYEDFQNICRTCLFIGKLRPIIDTVIINIVYGVSGTDVKRDAELPQKICESCYKKIYKINEFALQCKRNEIILNRSKSDYFERKCNEIKEEIITVDEMVQIKTELKSENITGRQNATDLKSCVETETVEEPNSAFETQIKDYRCSKCNRMFIEQEEYEKHRYVHEKVVYESEDCSNKFAKSRTLLDLEHHRSHKSYKKQFLYSCDECNKPIKHIATLKRHKKIHKTRKSQFDMRREHQNVEKHEVAFERVIIKSHPEEITFDTKTNSILAEDSDKNLGDSFEATNIENKTQKCEINEEPSCSLTINNIDLYCSDHSDSDPLDFSNNIESVNTNIGRETTNEETLEHYFDGKRIRDRNFCMYCKTTVLNFVRHITRNHLKEPEVKKIMCTPVGSRERKTLLSLLRKRGNYMINYKRCTKPVKKTLVANKFLPCIYCLGFYSSNQLWRHRKVCVANANASESAKINRPCAEAQNLLVQHLKVDETLRTLVFPRMRADEISLVAKNDALICAFGAHYLKAHHSEKHIVNVVSRKMRELAKLLNTLNNLQGTGNLFEFLNEKYFEIIVAAVKNVAKYDETKKIFVSSTYALQIGTSLKQCCEIALIANDLFDFNLADFDKEEIRNFLTYLERNWKLVVPNPPLVKHCFEREEKIHDFHLETLRQTKNKRVLIPWTLEQKKVVHEFFQQHIHEKRAPKKPECEALIRAHSVLLQNKNWLKIKVYVQNKYSK